MFRASKPLSPRWQRGPLRVMFVTTSMDVGGAETLLVNLIRRLDRDHFRPELCCLKHLGPLGEQLAMEIPTFSRLIRHKYDLPVLGKLTRLLEERETDAIITVGTGGDKMFWGRLAAWRAGVPVVCSALHSTGLPDRVERSNRLLTPLTDAFIAVAEHHGRYIAEHEGCPRGKVRVIPNGVDVQRFRPVPPSEMLRAELRLPAGTPTAAIVAALRPEKDHELFLRVAARVLKEVPRARFLVIGDGPRRAMLESLSRQLQISGSVHFLGTRSDVGDLLGLTDVVALTSKMEANPVSILEAMASERPVVAPAVGSIPESIDDGVTGYLTPPSHEADLARRIAELLAQPAKAQEMGRAAASRPSPCTRSTAWSPATKPFSATSTTASPAQPPPPKRPRRLCKGGSFNPEPTAKGRGPGQSQLPHRPLPVAVGSGLNDERLTYSLPTCSFRNTARSPWARSSCVRKRSLIWSVRTGDELALGRQIGDAAQGETALRPGEHQLDRREAAWCAAWPTARCWPPTNRCTTC